MNKRCWAALALAAALAAAAFFLPPHVSRWYDRQLMNEPQITQVEDREGLADSLRLTVAEKLLLMQEGELSYLALPGEDEEEWSIRLAGVRREMLALQRSGALPDLWAEDVQAELSDSEEVLCIDRETQVSFLIFHMALAFPDWNVGVTVDSQSGKILSVSLRWMRGQPPYWGAAGTASFGSAWRDYWGMDSVDANWNTPRMKEILSPALPLSGNSDYSAAGEINFTYDGQTLRVPVYGWCSGGSCAVQWNT